jgi:flagellar protein FliO/FliZ
MDLAFGTYLQFALALVFVVALIAVLAFAARRFGLAGSSGPWTRQGRRLQIVEGLALDGRRRLVLVRRDATEHLLLIGASSETVVESGIAAPPDAARPARPAAALEPAVVQSDWTRKA